ncbi:MAG: aminotransferase class V-fold PLP-dependent enzyme [Chlorobia bacterium]|nr:aminotransferase class V-fold PLP-dependent enzyme [Fimbriimonadaceae bacterium]
MPITRRNFLAGAASAFAFRNETLRGMDAIEWSEGSAQNEDFWLRLRGQFNVDPNLTVFNHAGLSPSPRVVLDAMAREAKRANADPSYVIWRKQDHELDGVRKDLATLVGCGNDELALTMNATYGLQTAIMGVPMSAGDEILATDHEYSRTFTAIDQRVRRDKVVSVILELKSPPESREKVAAQIIDKITPKTRLIVLSQMTFLTGWKMPIKEVAAAVAGRDVAILVDGAHGIGLLSEKFPDMGGHLYTACLHKWMMCPIGTGVFVVKSPWIQKTWPLHPADETLDGDITKFSQVGTRPAAPLLAIKEGLEFHNILGLDRKAARLEHLRNRLASRVLGEPGVVNLGSLDTRVCQAILTLQFDKANCAALAGWLLSKHKIHVTTMMRAGMDGIRISPNVFTTHEEVDRLGSILASVARTGIEG